MWLRFYTEYNIGVFIVESIPHCHTENALKIGKRLRSYIEDNVGVSNIDSIPHCLTENALKRN